MMENDKELLLDTADSITILYYEIRILIDNAERCRAKPPVERFKDVQEYDKICAEGEIAAFECVKRMLNRSFNEMLNEVKKKYESDMCYETTEMITLLNEDMDKLIKKDSKGNK